MSVSIFLNSSFIKLTGLLFILSVILYSNNAICRKEKNKSNFVVRHVESREPPIISSKEHRKILMIKQALESISKNEDFKNFKKLIKETSTSFLKVLEDVKEYIKSDTKFLKKSKLSKKSKLLKKPKFYKLKNSLKLCFINRSVSFYDGIEKLLKYFKNLLDKKKQYEDKYRNILTAISNILPNFKKISELVPVMKGFFYVEDENHQNIFENFYDSLNLLEKEIDELKKHYPDYTLNSDKGPKTHLNGTNSLNMLEKRNENLKKPELTCLDDYISDDKFDIAESVLKAFNKYYEDNRNDIKDLECYVEKLADINFSCVSCEELLNIYEKNLYG